MTSHNLQTGTLPQTTITNNSLMGYQYLIIFSMVYMMIMICNGILTNRYVSLTEHIFILGGTLTSPLTFILGDMIAEIFGYKVAKRIIWSGFASLMLFALICRFIVRAPYPDFFQNFYPYYFVLDQLLYIVVSSFLSFMISGLINIYIITKWKILLRGRYFWLRSLGASTIAEALYSAIAILLMEVGSISLSNIWKVILVSYSIKVTYSIILAIPSNLLVNYIKHVTKIDIYDYPPNYNPFENNDAQQEVKLSS